MATENQAMGDPAAADKLPENNAPAASETESVEQLKAQISELRAALDAKDGDIRAVKVNAAVDAALTAAGARNVTAVKALITGLDAAELSEDGTVKGLGEQIAALKASDGYLFEQRGLTLRGAKPAESGSDALEGADVSKMTYSQLSEYISKNPGANIFQ